MKGHIKGTWILLETEREEYWEMLEQFKQTYFDLKKRGKVPKGWNAHDTGIVTELERQARPFHKGGQEQRDPFESQLKKHAKAARKLYIALGHTQRITFADYIKLLGINYVNAELTRWEVREHMDERRNLAAVYNVDLKGF